MKSYQRVLILTALEQEEHALVKFLQASSKTLSFKTSSLNQSLDLHVSIAETKERTFYIVKTGIGSVNAAVALALAHQELNIDSVILLGVGGALKENLNIGDLVISSEVLQHDYIYTFDGLDRHVRPGALVLSSEEAIKNIAEIKADETLVQLIQKAEVTSSKNNATYIGTILSGNEFVGRSDRKQALASLKNNALLVEMEAAGVAQLSDRLNIPFVIVKTVSDRLLPDGSIENDFQKCLEAACAHAASAIQNLI